MTKTLLSNNSFKKLSLPKLHILYKIEKSVENNKLIENENIINFFVFKFNILLIIFIFQLI